jgi:hypothetical protein
MFSGTRMSKKFKNNCGPLQSTTFILQNQTCDLLSGETVPLSALKDT